MVKRKWINIKTFEQQIAKMCEAGICINIPQMQKHALQNRPMNLKGTN